MVPAPKAVPAKLVSVFHKRALDHADLAIADCVEENRKRLVAEVDSQLAQAVGKLAKLVQSTIAKQDDKASSKSAPSVAVFSLVRAVAGLHAKNAIAPPVHRIGYCD